jgi:hypothetical protein
MIDIVPSGTPVAVAKPATVSPMLPSTGSTAMQWNETTTYPKDAVVSHNRKTFKAILQNVGEPPEYTPKVWRREASKGSTTSAPVTTSVVTPAVKGTPETTTTTTVTKTTRDL